LLSNLAGLSQAQNRYADAEPLLGRSLEIWEGLLGADHPDVVRSREILTQVRRAQGGDAAVATAPPAAAPAPEAPAQAAPSQAAPAAPSAGVAEGAAPADGPQPLGQIATAPPATSGGTAAPEGEGEIGAGGPQDAERAVAALTLGTQLPEAQPRRRAVTPAPPVQGLPEEDPDDQAQPGGNAPGDNVPEQPEERFTTVDPRDLDAALTPAEDAPVFMVYLSTLWSQAEAQRYWQSLKQTMPEVFGPGADLQIEEVAVNAGEGAFYRVLAGPFASDPEAATVCDAVQSRLKTHDCSVVAR
jgi:hypothetical protein